MGKTFNMTGGSGGGGGGISLSSIAVTTPPTKTAYQVGDTFDQTGMVVTATYTNGATLVVGGYTVSPQTMTLGVTSVTVSYTEGGVTKTATQAVTVISVDPVLNNNSWAVISGVSQDGTGANYWSIGDCKEISLNGTVGTKSYTNVSLCVFILMFNCPINKNTADNNIIWGGFKTALTNGTDVALDDANYETNPTSGTKAFSINHAWQSSTSSGAGYFGTKYGGWSGTDVRYDILGATSTAPSQYNTNKNSSNVGYDATLATISSPVSNTLMAALPTDFRNVLRLWTRYFDNSGSSESDASVTAVVDAISMLAEFEVFGARTYANQYEQNHQTHLTYYAAGNSKIKNVQSGNTAAWWWMASPCYVSSPAECFCRVSPSGAIYTGTSCGDLGLYPAFRT